MSRREWWADGVLALGLAVFTAGVTGFWGDRFSTVDRAVDV
jgi:hypothetical protein